MDLIVNCAMNQYLVVQGVFGIDERLVLDLTFVKPVWIMVNITATKTKSKNMKNQWMSRWPIAMHVDMSSATEVINMYTNV